LVRHLLAPHSFALVLRRAKRDPSSLAPTLTALQRLTDALLSAADRPIARSDVRLATRAASALTALAQLAGNLSPLPLKLSVPSVLKPVGALWEAHRGSDTVAARAARLLRAVLELAAPLGLKPGASVAAFLSSHALLERCVGRGYGVVGGMAAWYRGD
jgi:hypothetical protein